MYTTSVPSHLRPELSWIAVLQSRHEGSGRILTGPPEYSSFLLEETFHRSVRQDKTRQDKTRQDKTRQDKTRQDKTRQEKQCAFNIILRRVRVTILVLGRQELLHNMRVFFSRRYPANNAHVSCCHQWPVRL